jgi:TetR/AcrR family transcriptional regulator
MNGRERILKAAEQQFGVRSYQEVSIAPILAAADVQAPTLYYHFGDKEGLFVAWVQEAFTPLQLNVRHMDNLEEGLAAYATMYFTVVRFNIPQVLRDIDHLVRDASKEEIYNAYFQRVYEPLCALLISGMEKGELPPEPVQRVADLFLSGLYVLYPQVDKEPAGIARWYARRFLYGHRG